MKNIEIFWAKSTNTILEWIKRKNYKIILKWFMKDTFVVDKWTFNFSKKFEDYIYNENAINTLLKDLDEDSINTVNWIIHSIKLILNTKDWIIDANELWLESIEETNQINKYMSSIKDKYKLPIENYEESVFYFKHGIDNIENLNLLIKWKDCIDCWWYVWDSSILFAKELDFNNVYTLEPEAKNLINIEKTIKLNNMQGKISPINIWVWDKKMKLKITTNWASSTLSDSEWDYSIDIDSLDNIVNEYNINPWLIKWDIEWYEYESIIWAENIIKKYKPVLIISIYHRWKDFFEIKPLLESWDIWYKFKVVRCYKKNPFSETVLICY